MVIPSLFRRLSVSIFLHCQSFCHSNSLCIILYLPIFLSLYQISSTNLSVIVSDIICQAICQCISYYLLIYLSVYQLLSANLSVSVSVIICQSICQCISYYLPIHDVFVIVPVFHYLSVCAIQFLSLSVPPMTDYWRCLWPELGRSIRNLSKLK